MTPAHYVSPMEKRQLLSLRNVGAVRKYLKTISKAGSATAILLATIILFTTPAHAITVGNNVNLVPDLDRQLAEPTIAIDPQNPSIMVAGAQDYNFAGPRQHRWHAIYRSTDAGQSWTNSLLPGYPGDTSPQGASSPLKAYTLTTDPAMAFDNYGSLYYAGLALSLTSGEETDFVAKYTNDGATYTGVTLIPGFGDYPKIAVDTTGGPHNGNIYFTSFQGFSVSTDGGNTFTSPVPIRSEPTGVKVGPTGIVYIVSETAPPFQSSAPINILVTTSTDGGQTLSGHEMAAFNITSLPFQLPGNQFREFTLPEIAVDGNGAYVTWADYRTGLSNILFVRSTDNGQTWSDPITINDVTYSQHFTPTIVASAGTISIAWYDDRLSTIPNGTIDSLDVYYAQSTNTGHSFTPNMRVTSVSFNPNQAKIRDFARGAPFLGDYISISAGPGFVQPVWADQRNACDVIDPNFGCVDEDIFTARITV